MGLAEKSELMFMCELVPTVGVREQAVVDGFGCWFGCLCMNE